MAIKIELKRSAVPGKVPSTSSLDLGEVAINTFDGKAYFKKNDGTQKIVQLADVSGSIASASFAVTASYALNSQNIDTGSIVSTSSFNAYTSSINSYTSSLNSTTSSFVRNSQTSSMSVASASFAATSSFASNFTVANTLTAQTLVVQTISSSIIYSSGSNIFGNSLNNTQVFTGSVIVTGSLAVNNSNVILTNQTSSMSVLSASYASTASFALNSQNINTGSFATTGSNQFNGNQSITGSLIQGLGNIATGENSHAEGDSTQAIGLFSHAEGLGTIAYGGRSHAEGQDTIASGSYSHAEGYQTIALADHQHVQGQYNATSSVPAAFIVGNGTDDSNRSNLIHAAGNEVQISGSLNITQGITGSLNGTASFATTASYALFAANGGGATNQISTGSITASVDVSPNNLFLIKSGSNVYFNISSSSNTTLSSDLFIIKNFTTQQPVLTISQSVVQFATQSTIPTGTTQAGSIWFTSSSLYIGLE
jgi:hypothetical protein